MPSPSLASPRTFTALRRPVPLRCRRAERANSLTHGLGFVLSLAAAAILLSAAQGRVDVWLFAAYVVYVASMVAVYATSTCSHVFWRPRLNYRFRILDQGFIFLFIAGSYTPVAAAFLRDGAWWLLLAAIWLVALGGFASKVIWTHRINASSAAIPIVLGWMPLLGGPSMLALIPIGLVWWMLAGGLCYTLGTAFLAFDHRHRYLHAVWHLFVIAGSACQFWAIYHYTLPS